MTHTCHAYSTLWSSPFYNLDRILIVTIDGPGDAACATYLLDQWGIERQITIENDYSICILYSYFTKVSNADEGKLEALADIMRRVTY